MSDKKDDPREVLTLLNSLGFVGITAQQLKAFMKDLKMHRKIKERERQQWKDETKKKILLRQQELYREVLQEHKIEALSLNNGMESTISSESSTFHDDSSYKVVTVKIRCIPKDKENKNPEEKNFDDKTERNNNNKNSKKTHTSWAEEFRQNSLRNDDNGYNTSSTSSVNESQGKSYGHFNSRSQNHSAGASTDSTKYISLEKPKNKASEQNLKQSNLAPPKSPRRTKSSSSRHPPDRSEGLKHGRLNSEQNDDVLDNPPPSRSSVQSKPKSFIRPWRLQPESHRSTTNTKSDPVALYQKYKEEWKQFSLPGEENHAGIRWAVREKMLGIDPNPRPDDKMIRELDRNYGTNSNDSQSILDRGERKIHRRKSRKIRKPFPKRNPIGFASKPVFISRRKRYASFQSISASFLLRATSSKSPNNSKARSPRSILALPTDYETCDLKEIKIERNFKTESLSHCISCSGICSMKTHESRFKEIHSEVESAKKTLGRLVKQFLARDIESYAETYKYIDKCCCVSQTQNYE